MTEGKPHPAYTRYHWAKSDRKNQGRIHLLEHHLADVGTCFEALMRQPTIRKRLASTGGLNDLKESLVARLSVFAALHDIGKVNMGFQTQIWKPEELPGRRPMQFRRVGHTLDLTPVLTWKDETTAAWFFDALGWWYDATESWDDRGGETVCAMLVATLSHHGRPLRLEDSRSENPAIWRKFGDLKPEDCVKRVGNLLRLWFPAAFTPGGSTLPCDPAFQHMFLGLCNWADWIGSNEEWFPYVDAPQDDYIKTARKRAKQAVDAIGLDLSDQRRDFKRVPEFRTLFGISGSPNAIQKTACDTPIDRRLVIIESETGSGKTEAALWRFAHMYEAGLVDGLYFALPTRSAAVQIHERVERFIRNLFPRGVPPVVLAVPGYEPGVDASSVAMQDYEPWWEDRHDDDRPWASKSPKRYLAAQIAVGTVDQAMMCALQVKNAHMRAACLARNLLVVDEVHASDTYMSVVLEALINAHVRAGGYALLMSATLGSSARHRWLHHGQRLDYDIPLGEAEDAPYPAVSISDGRDDNLIAAGENDQGKTVSVEASPTMHDFEDTARRALTAARAGAKVLVVRNTVDHAVKTQQALEERAEAGDAGLLFDVEGIPTLQTLHHGRFAACDRALLDKRIENLLGKERQPGGRVVVGTQTLEQSLDIDADLLITDLSPVDVLLQRIGRLHRHKNNNPNRPRDYAKPTCVVLTPPDGLAPLLKSGQNPNGLGPHGGVYGSLSILEATRRLIDEHPEWRIPEMNRLLVERATHPEALNAITEEMGEDWKEHAIKTEGGEIADKQHARGHTVKRDKSFFHDNRDVLFVSDEEKIRTRLGDDRIDIALDPPQPSPFDALNSIDKLAVSVRWLPDGDAPESVTPSPADGGFTFAIGDRRFVYDRLGLRRA